MHSIGDVVYRTSNKGDSILKMFLRVLIVFNMCIKLREFYVLIFSTISGFVAHNKVSSNLQINTSTWKDGVYIVTIKSEGDIILQDKIMLMHK